MPHGTCVGGACVCEKEWRGADCARSTCPTEPANNTEPCSGHGTCKAGECKCDKGYKGDACEVDRASRASRLACAREECTSESHGFCANVDEGPCTCLTGWLGPACATALCPDECNGNGFCTDSGCSCYPSYRGRACEHSDCPNDCLRRPRLRAEGDVAPRTWSCW